MDEKPTCRRVLFGARFQHLGRDVRCQQIRIKRCAAADAFVAALYHRLCGALRHFENKREKKGEKAHHEKRLAALILDRVCRLFCIDRPAVHRDAKSGCPYRRHYYVRFSCVYRYFRAVYFKRKADGAENRVVAFGI